MANLPLQKYGNDRNTTATEKAFSGTVNPNGDIADFEVITVSDSSPTASVRGGSQYAIVAGGTGLAVLTGYSISDTTLTATFSGSPASVTFLVF